MSAWTPAQLWLVFAAVALIALATRAIFIVLHGRASFPGWFRRALAFVPAAVLAAIAIPGTLTVAGQVSLAVDNPSLWAGIAALLVAWRTRNVTATIAGGMVALWLIQWGMGRLA